MARMRNGRMAYSVLVGRPRDRPKQKWEDSYVEEDGNK